MAERGLIQARLALDSKAYKTGLADALKDAKTFSAALKNELKIPVIPPLPAAARGGVDRR